MRYRVASRIRIAGSIRGVGEVLDLSAICGESAARVATQLEAGGYAVRVEETFGAPCAESPALPAAAPVSSPGAQEPHLSTTPEQPKRAKRGKG